MRQLITFVVRWCSFSASTGLIDGVLLQEYAMHIQKVPGQTLGRCATAVRHVTACLHRQDGSSQRQLLWVRGISVYQFCVSLSDHHLCDLNAEMDHKYTVGLPAGTENSLIAINEYIPRSYVSTAVCSSSKNIEAINLWLLELIVHVLSVVSFRRLW
jgi:hypothetical protein